MGEDTYPWWHPHYRPPVKRRDMKQIKSDFNKNLNKHSLSKTKAR